MTIVQRLGLPSMGGRYPLIGSMGIDSLGSGLFLPFAVVYFLKTTNLGLQAVGAALSIGAACALAVGPVIGVVIDRIGAKTMLVAANLVQAAGFAGYLVVGDVSVLAAAAFVVNVGQNAFWVANGPVIGMAADPGERQQWFGLSVSLRNFGYGVGAIVAGVLVGVGDRNAYHAVALLNLVSFLLAAGLVLAWQGPGVGQWRAEEQGARSAKDRSPGLRGYVGILRNRRFMLLVAVNVVMVLFAVVFTVVLSVYVVDTLGGPGWLASAAFVVNTLLVVLLQPWVSKRLAVRSKLFALRAAAATWAISFVMFAALQAARPVVLIIVTLAGVVLYTAAELLYSTTMPDLVSSMAPEDQRGRYFAVYQLSWSVPGVVAPAGFTAMLAAGPWFLWGPLAALGVLTATGLAVARSLDVVGEGNDDAVASYG